MSSHASAIAEWNETWSLAAVASMLLGVVIGLTTEIVSEHLS
jgi:hypothetical protein